MTKITISPLPSDSPALMTRVGQAIQQRGLDLKSAATEIGVTANTLQGHLRGEHVRSDSARKYENWLAGRPKEQKVFVFSLPERPVNDVPTPAEESLPTAPNKPWLVVDVFSGCGGLSLGFDLLGSSAGIGGHFKTVLAIDNQRAPIGVLNHNAAFVRRDGSSPGRVVDLTEFANEAEFLAFYLEHTAAQHGDPETLGRLNALTHGAFQAFRKAIHAVDANYLVELASIRADRAWRRACDHLDRQALNQTSVIGFHEKLRLPRTGLRPPVLPQVLWGEDNLAGDSTDLPHPPDALLESAAEDWDAEVAALEIKREGSGRGQLTASARRVASFVQFLRSPVFRRVREVWCAWRARRAMLRAGLFDNSDFAREIRTLYAETYPVSVLVGGPPCQGFSRIGRGKIRSLRDALVHVHGHQEAGDARNLLFRQYVMVLGALRPPVFLFENVQHFQSTVKANGVEFEATEVLAEAIANASGGEVAYEVSSRVIDASRHGVPQARQRFFMAGVLQDSAGQAIARSQAEHCLSLALRAEVPLSAALAGLPEPYLIGGDVPAADAMRNPVRLAGMPSGNGSSGRFVGWVRQPPAGSQQAPKETDAHAARASRIDDSAFFGLMGPGKRWMDYRADDAPTIRVLRELLATLANLPPKVFKEIAARSNNGIPDRDSLLELLGRLDGSLPIRLLLEQIGERLGAPHHLLTSSYLAKRDGNHGDWVARLDASRPAKTIVSHMGKDTYGYIHPAMPRTISVREAARVQTFPDWFAFGEVALTDAFRMIGNAVPPLLSYQIAARVAQVLSERSEVTEAETPSRRLRQLA